MRGLIYRIANPDQAKVSDYLRYWRRSHGENGEVVLTLAWLKQAVAVIQWVNHVKQTNNTKQNNQMCCTYITNEKKPPVMEKNRNPLSPTFFEIEQGSEKERKRRKKIGVK